MAPAKCFEELVVWQKSHALVLSVYQLSKEFPRAEMYGLTAQLRRSATSVPANIAEGFRKLSRSDKARLLNIAQGSLEETRYYLILARDLGYMKEGEIEVLNQVAEISRMLDAYWRAIRLSAET